MTKRQTRGSVSRPIEDETEFFQQNKQTLCCVNTKRLCCFRAVPSPSVHHVVTALVGGHWPSNDTDDVIEPRMFFLLCAESKVRRARLLNCSNRCFRVWGVLWCYDRHVRRWEGWEGLLVCYIIMFNKEMNRLSSFLFKLVPDVFSRSPQLKTEVKNCCR